MILVLHEFWDRNFVGVVTNGLPVIHPLLGIEHNDVMPREIDLISRYVVHEYL